MWKLINFFLLPLLLSAHELEVRLPTRSQAKSIYLSQLYTDPSSYDWRYFDEVRAVLESDLNASGFCAVLASDPKLEETLNFPEIRSDFNLHLWRKEKIPFVIAAKIDQNSFSTTVVNVEKGSSKKYASFLLTGRIEEDRRAVHQLAEAIQKDLFGSPGISSLRILYTERTKNPVGNGWLSEVWICDADGANARQLTHEKSYCLSPSFYPKSNQFFYVCDKTGQSKIYRASLLSLEGELLVDLRGNQALPNLSRKGQQMAFITDVAGRPDLFLQNFDSAGKPIGKARQLFSCPRATQASPCFSPDGKQVAFVSDKDGPPRIYVLETNPPDKTVRQKPRLLTKKNRENTSPSWSPDGTKLAYSAKIDGVRQIWVYHFDTEEEIQLTTGPYNKENPSWAPDNFHLVYNTETEDACELFITDLHRSSPLQITKGTGQKRFASWEMR